jgi:hypothetical protein
MEAALMMNTKSVVVSLIFLTLLTVPALPQATELGGTCDLSVLGAKETRSFLEFDRELRYALSSQDAGVMALLVKPSLRVDDDRGSFYIDDPRSLQLRFDEIFPPTVRDAVLKSRPEKLWCNYGGVSYSDGLVWVNYSGEHYAIQTVNIPASAHPPKAPGNTAEFVCDADKHRVIVDAVGDGPPRYRAWTKPHSITEKPDLEIAAGKRGVEGSGPCSYTIWKFTNNGTEFDLSGPGGCYEESKQPPADSKGTLEVSVPGKPIVSWWCR